MANLCTCTFSSTIGVDLYLLGSSMTLQVSLRFLGLCPTVTVLTNPLLARRGGLKNNSINSSLAAREGLIELIFNRYLTAKEGLIELIFCSLVAFREGLIKLIFRPPSLTGKD